MTARFDILTSDILGLCVLQRKPKGDSRGYLERMFCTEELDAIIGGKTLIQVNHTYTATLGTVRGMHFQSPPHADAKLVSCLHGEVFDIAVDLRRNSPTFLHWHGEKLTADNHKTHVIPEGFAHGLQTLVDDCDMLYFHTAAYQPSGEGSIHPLDPMLAIRWPLPVRSLSPRDATHPFLNKDFAGVAL